ncbi:MAG: iron chelate uptake ABC transporter family permease subunit, partial [Acidimicrobiia bacterium]
MTGDEIRPSRLHWWWFGGALLVLAAAVLVSVMLGAVDLDASSIVASLVDRLPLVDVDSGLTNREEAILWDLRMPRVVLGGIVGATLAVAGGSYQGAFRNPLADPYLLGVAAGAGLGATIAIAYGPSIPSTPFGPLPLMAFIGGIAGVAATYAIGYSVRAGRTAVTLILAGVAVASFLTAVQTYLQQRNAETL